MLLDKHGKGLVQDVNVKDSNVHTIKRNIIDLFGGNIEAKKQNTVGNHTIKTKKAGMC